MCSYAHTEGEKYITVSHKTLPTAGEHAGTQDKDDVKIKTPHPAAPDLVAFTFETLARTSGFRTTPKGMSFEGGRKMANSLCPDRAITNNLDSGAFFNSKKESGYDEVL